MLNPSIDVGSRAIPLQCLRSAAAFLCLTDEPLGRSIKASYGSQSLGVMITHVKYCFVQYNT